MYSRYRPGSHSMPTRTSSAPARSRIGLIDSANCLAALSGGIPPRHRPDVMLMLLAPIDFAKSSDFMINCERSARCCGLGLINPGSKYASGGASFQYPKLQLQFTLLTARFV